MNLSEEQKNDLIQDYLDELLTKEELADFEALLERDEEFRKRVILEKAFHEERERAIEARIVNEAKALKKEQTKPTPIYKLPVFQIAASLVIIALAGWLTFGNIGGDKVMDSSRMSLLELNQTSLGLVPNPDKLLSEYDLEIVKSKDYDFHYSFDKEVLKLYLTESVDIGLIRLAYEAKSNMYLLYIRDTAYEIFPRAGEVRPLEVFN